MESTSTTGRSLGVGPSSLAGFICRSRRRWWAALRPRWFWVRSGAMTDAVSPRDAGFEELAAKCFSFSVKPRELFGSSRLRAIAVASLVRSDSRLALRPSAVAVWSWWCGGW